MKRTSASNRKHCIQPQTRNTAQRTSIESQGEIADVDQTKKSKSKPKRRHRVVPAGVQINTRRTYQRAFDVFHQDDDPDQALALLQQIEAQGRMSLEAMSLYLDVLHELRDINQYARIATAMAEKELAKLRQF